jgi:catechol 2,3-dioxygenase-like lactoylglutathione lyase family enzyme
MLSEAKLHPIILTSRLEEAETFYRDTLGLPLVGHSDGALVFRVGDGDLRIGPVESVAPSGHTALAFSVPDLDSTVAKLVASGVTFERFPMFEHAANGVTRSPEGTLVAWLRDPDGNLLAVVQVPDQASRSESKLQG